MPHAKEGNYERFLADATIFMDFFSTIVIGWQWLKMANAATEMLANNSNDHSFFINYKS